MSNRDLLLTVCLIGGMCGIVAGAGRRDPATALLGLIIVTISLAGLY